MWNPGDKEVVDPLGDQSSADRCRTYKLLLYPTRSRRPTTAALGSYGGNSVPTPRPKSHILKLELAPPPSRLHPVTAIDRQNPSTSVTCTYVQKVQDKSPDHLACKALNPSSILGAASRVWAGQKLFLGSVP